MNENKTYDPDWPEPGEGRETKRLSFWKFLFFFSLLEAAVAAAAAFCSGCATDPETGDVTIRVPAAAVDAVTNLVREIKAKAEAEAAEKSSGEAPGGEAGPGQGSAGASADSASAASSPSPSLVWRYGGFDGSKAAEDPACRISGLKVGSSSLSLKWETGVPASWAANKTEKGNLVVVAAFYQSGGKWIGGKFDWIDASRSSRSLENIMDGYGGWDASAWRAAKKHALVVVSADGKKRSNLVED